MTSFIWCGCAHGKSGKAGGGGSGGGPWVGDRPLGGLGGRAKKKNIQS
jgi:hypothetical protein